MIMKILKSKKGSTLLLAIVVLSILSILGTAMISLSVVNFRRQIVDRNIKTSFYLAEAGLEEAHAVIGKEVENAILAGNQKVIREKDRLQTFIQSERDSEQIDPDLDESIFIDGTDGYGPVNKEAIEPIMNEWFRAGFADYINGNLESVLINKNKNNNDNDNNDDNYGIVDGDIDNKNPDVSIAENSIRAYTISVDTSTIHIDTTTRQPRPYVGEVPYSITLQSNFIHRNITKQIEGIFSIRIPDYNIPYYVRNMMIQMDDNILWKRAITTEKDIYVTGENNVTINGNIYAYGTKPSDEKDTGDFGGIVVGANGARGNLVVNGNVITSSYVHTNDNDSSITINNGQVYCNSLVTQKGTENTSIRITNGSLNTEDDIELNGKNADIEINGSYYGFSDGSGSTEHNRSSSIVINSPDIDSNSSLRIENGEVYIAGTVYINKLKDTTGNYFDYQTGESVSIKGNYKAYGEHLSNDSIKYSDTDSSKREEKFKPSNIELKNYNPLVLIDKDGEIKTAMDKSKYIKYYYEDYQDGLSSNDDKDPYNDLTLGKNNININNVIYNIGISISNGIIKEGMIPLENQEALHKLKAKENEYKYHINKMADPIYGNGNPQDIDETVLDELMGTEQDVFSFEDRRFSFSENISSITRNDDGAIKEIIFVNDDSNRPLIIVGPTGNNSGVGLDDQIYSTDNNLKGIIVTKGDVYIRGQLNYTGIIVTKGNVHIEDNNTKTITHNEEYILQRVYSMDILKNQFVNKKRNGFTNEENIQTTRPFLVELEAAAEDVGSFLNYGRVIDIQWSQIR